ncbi:PAS domain S-box protein [Spirosoma soli]|uniref:histidine kinase n=1 Tax=Spirosoma soli TaxID=1770529 RepID=A0ABW5M1M2_9BACT
MSLSYSTSVSSNFNSADTGFGTLLCDPVWSQDHTLIDLIIRWANPQAGAYFSFDPTLIQPGNMLSAWLKDSLATSLNSVYHQLDLTGSATIDAIINRQGLTRFRFSALHTGYVVMLERIENVPLADTAIQQQGVLKDLLDKLPGASAVWAPIRNESGVIIDFQPVLINQLMATLMTKNWEEIKVQTLLEFYPSGTENGFFSKLVSISEQGETLDYDHHYQRDGQSLWLNVSMFHINGNVVAYCRDITDRKRIEADIVRRLKLESIISSLSSRLININTELLESCIVDALQQIGIYNQADRVYISMYSKDRQFMTCLYEWCASGIQPQKHLLQNRPVGQYSWWREMIDKNQIICIRSLDELPPQAAEVKLGLQTQGVQSILSIPLKLTNQQGLIGFTSVRQERDWDERDIVLLKTFAGIVVNALNRQQNEQTVQRTYKRLEGLQRIDKALLENSLTDKHPAIIALQHINDLIPCERLLIFSIDHAQGLARAEGRLVDGIVDAYPDIVLPARFFYTEKLLAGRTISIQELTTDNPWIPPMLNLYDRGFRSMALVPLFSQDQYIGVFILVSKTPNFFPEEQLEIAQEVGRQLSIALYQQQLRDQVKQHTELLEQRVVERTAEIRQLSALQNAILEHAGLAIVSTDTSGLIQSVNPAAEKLLGYKADELIGKVHPTLVFDPNNSGSAVLSYRHDYSYQADSSAYRLNLTNQGYYSLECKLNGKEGRTIPALVTISVLQDETGLIMGYVGMATDITALKTAKLELERKKDELETFFEASLDLHCIAEADGTLLKINRSWETTFGYTTAEILSRNFMELVHPDDRQGTIDNIRKIVDRLPLDRVINRMRKKDGSYCLIEWNAIAHENLIYASARDITEQRESEEQLRTANHRLQLATWAARQGIWELDLTDFSLFWDERQHEMHGTSADTFGGHMNDFLKLVHPDDLAFIQSLHVERMSEHDEPIGGEKRIIRPDGQLRYLETHSRLVLGKDGKPEKMVGVSWDVTKRKQTELDLRASEERYRSLVNNLKEIVFQTDLYGCWTFLNPAWEEITGFTVTESLGQPFNALVDPADRPLTIQLFEDLIVHKKTSFPYIIQYQHKTGEHRWAEILAHVMLDNEGQPIGSTGTITDITERKQSLDALRESEQRFRDFAENVDEVFWIHAANPFRLLYINPAYERVWGRSCRSLYENEATYMDTIIDEDKDVAIAAWARYRSGEDGSVQYRMKAIDGIRWISVRTFITKDANGSPIRYIGIANDITGQKEKELVLQTSLQREQELNQLKSQFVSTASHEFRTPLSTIQSSVDLVKMYLNRPDASAKASVERHLGVIQKEIANFSDLLSDILTIGKIEAGKIAFNPRLTDILALAKDVIATHFHQWNDKRTLQLHVDGTPHLVYLDDKLMTHVLVNLLSNAFKFSKQDPELHIRFCEHQVSLLVVDRGIGIPAEDLPHLFETFYRARNAISIPGSGLGLVITRQFVELQGGTITVQSQENQGTTFTIKFPLDMRSGISSH